MVNRARPLCRDCRAPSCAWCCQRAAPSSSPSGRRRSWQGGRLLLLDRHGRGIFYFLCALESGSRGGRGIGGVVLLFSRPILPGIHDDGAAPARGGGGALAVSGIVWELSTLAQLGPLKPVEFDESEIFEERLPSRGIPPDPRSP